MFNINFILYTDLCNSFNKKVLLDSIHDSLEQVYETLYNFLYTTIQKIKGSLTICFREPFTIINLEYRHHRQNHHRQNRLLVFS